MDDPPDKVDCVEQALCDKHGSVEGFLLWYQRWFDGIAYRNRLPYSEWEDTAQEILRTACDQMRRGLYRGDGTLRAWLERIAKGKIADYWRQPNHFTAAIEIDNFSEDSDAIGINLIQRGRTSAQSLVVPPADASSREIVQRALSSLPEEEQLVLILNVRFGFTICEISRILSIPVGTIGRRLRDAKNRFRHAVKRLSC